MSCLQLGASVSPIFDNSSPSKIYLSSLRVRFYATGLFYDERTKFPSPSPFFYVKFFVGRPNENIFCIIRTYIIQIKQGRKIPSSSFLSCLLCHEITYYDRTRNFFFDTSSFVLLKDFFFFSDSKISFPLRFVLSFKKGKEEKKKQGKGEKE